MMPGKIIFARFLTMVSHPVVLAVVAAGIFLFIFPGDFQRFRLKLTDSNRYEVPNRHSEYRDINGDGNVERVFSKNLTASASLVVLSAEESILGAWKLPGFWYTEPDYSLADTDGDGSSEMFAITVSPGDSVLVTHIDLASDTLPLTTRFICSLNRLNDTLDQLIEARGMLDVTGDSCPEFLFNITAGYTLHPRQLYAWDIVRDEILTAPLSGQPIRSQILAPPGEFSDGNPMIFIEVMATCNHSGPVPYSDTASYAIVYTSWLNYLFPPVYAGSAQSRTTTLPFNLNGSETILAITNHLRRISGRITFRLLDGNGRVIQVKENIDLSNSLDPFLWNGKIFLREYLNKSTNLYSVEPDLEVTLQLSLAGRYLPVDKSDMDLDGKEELIFLETGTGSVAILKDDLKSMTSSVIPWYTNPTPHVSTWNSEEGVSNIYFQFLNLSTLLEYSRNPFYPFRYTYYVGIFLGFTVLFLGLQKLFIYSNQRKRIREEEIVRLQLQSVMNQLNPHFTFNAINSIGNAILQGNNMEAYEYFTSLSDLIRKTMHNAFEPFKTLGEEIEFVKQYLKIESYRFNGRLKWEMKVHPNVDTAIIVPKMLIHIFVENALKHGIFHNAKGGCVEILVHPTSLGMLIMITDDGIGMVKASEINREKGNGLRILNGYLQLFNRQQKHTISYQLLDRGSPETGVSGTRVLISIVFRRDRQNTCPEYPEEAAEDIGKAVAGPDMAM
jgi:hypothetical protein